MHSSSHETVLQWCCSISRGVKLLVIGDFVRLFFSGQAIYQQMVLKTSTHDIEYPQLCHRINVTFLTQYQQVRERHRDSTRPQMMSVIPTPIPLYEILVCYPMAMGSYHKFKQALTFTMLWATSVTKIYKQLFSLQVYSDATEKFSRKRRYI